MPDVSFPHTQVTARECVHATEKRSSSSVVEPGSQRAVQGVTRMIEWAKHLLSFPASYNNKAWFENPLPKALVHASYVAQCAGALHASSA